MIRMKRINVGLVQMKCSEIKNQNLEKAVHQIREVAAKGADIVCLQELFATTYFCDVEDYSSFDLAETIPGPTSESLGELARELNIVIIASLFEKRAAGIYHNTAIVIDADGRCLGKYRKMHIPDDPGYYEKFYFTPGDLGFKVFETKFAKVGLLICWDQWFPEAARITSIMGAELLFYPTAIGWERNQDEVENQDQYAAWQISQRGHAIANSIPVVSVNRVGYEKDGITQFWGGSFVSSGTGKLLYLASHDKEETVVVPLNIADSRTIQRRKFLLNNRRVETYKPILNILLDGD
jgi:N-carbamoylputrescine amidase